MTRAPVLAILAGKAAPLTHEARSGIAKLPVRGKARIGFLGVEGDEQADLSVHGGPDKALHHYPTDHYVHWGSLAVEHPLLNMPGAFGENVSTWGLLEHHVCIGDRFRCGTALLEISQGRQPCWKQAARLQWRELPQLMVQTRRSGWYYRVIEEGEAGEGDEIVLVDRVHPEWTVRRVFGLLIGGEHREDPAALNALAKMPQLFEGWRERAVDLSAGRAH